MTHESVLASQVHKSAVASTNQYNMASKMTTKLCPHLTAFVMLMVALGLSSRISDEVRRGKLLGTITRFAHLFAFGTWLGVQFWATFIAGESCFLLSFHYTSVLSSKRLDLSSTDLLPQKCKRMTLSLIEVIPSRHLPDALYTHRF